MANKDRSRLVVSFRAGNDVFSWVNSLAENKGISRGVALGLLLEPILQAYVMSDSTLKTAVCSDENINGKATSQMSFRASDALVNRVDSIAENEGLSRSAVLGMLFSAASKDTTFRSFTHKNSVLTGENKGAEIAPMTKGVVKKAPVPFRAAVKEATTAAGLDDGKKEPGDKEDSFFDSLLKGLAWVGGAILVVAIALAGGKAPGGSSKFPGPGFGGPRGF